MAIIQSGASADLLTIDALSKAARVTLYNSKGQLANEEYDSNHSAPIECIPTTLTDGTTYFAMRNTGAQHVHLHKMRYKIGFSGTAGATRSAFQLRRFSTATPTGGTAVTPVKFDTRYAPSSVGDIRNAPAGLTLTGVVFETRFETLACTNQLSNDESGVIDFGEHKFILLPGEGFAISAFGNVVAGCWLIGQISWDENAG